MGITKASLFFHCFLLFLDPATWRLAVPALLTAPVFCPHLPSSSGRKCLKSMIICGMSTHRFKANVQYHVPNCSGVALVSSLQAGVFNCSAHAAPGSCTSQWGNSAQTYARAGGCSERCQHMDLPMQCGHIWGSHENWNWKQKQIMKLADKFTPSPGAFSHCVFPQPAFPM